MKVKIFVLNGGKVVTTDFLTWGRSLGMGRLHAMCWNSVILSAKIDIRVCLSPLSPCMKIGMLELAITLVI